MVTVSNQAQIGFFSNATAASATISSNAGGLLAFTATSSAGTAHITNNGGGITVFTGSSTGATATIVNNAASAVDISYTGTTLGGAGSLSIGSLSGAGNVYLGDSNLILGNLNQNDGISGVISDGVSPQFIAYQTAKGTAPPTLSGGAVTKVGSGTLSLGAVNTYTGGTAIDGGILQVSQDANLGDAAGALSFDGGTLETTADMASGRTVTLSGAGTFLTDDGTTLTPEWDGFRRLAPSSRMARVRLSSPPPTATAAAPPSRRGRCSLATAARRAAVVGDLTDNGALAFDRSDSVTFEGRDLGGGSVSQIGAGTTILTADNSYTARAPPSAPGRCSWATVAPRAALLAM